MLLANRVFQRRRYNPFVRTSRQSSSDAESGLKVGSHFGFTFQE